MHPSMLFDSHTHTISASYIGIYQLNPRQVPPTDYFFSVGLNPVSLQQYSEKEKLDFLDIEHTKNCSAIGEIGLDTRAELPLEIQEKWFVTQLQLAHSLNLPIILHCLNAWDRCRFLHAKHAPNQPLIYHGFSKSSIIHQVLGYDKTMISLGASILSNTALQEAVAQIPIERLLLETDDTTIDLLKIYSKVARLKSLSLPALIKLVQINAQRIFKL